MNPDDVPRTPTSEQAWKNLSAIADAQNRSAPQGMGFEAEASGLNRPRPNPIVAGGSSSLAKNLHKAKMDKLVGGSDPREPGMCRTPVNSETRSKVEDLPRTPTSQGAWETVNRIAAAQEKKVHHDGPSLEMMGAGGPAFDPREPDLPRTPVAGVGKKAESAVGGGAAGAPSRLQVRLDSLETSKKGHGLHAELDVLDMTGNVLYHEVSKEATATADGVFQWQPPAMMDVPIPSDGASKLRIKVVGKKLLVGMTVGECVLPAHLLGGAGMTAQPEPLLKSKNGETSQGGVISFAAWR